MKTYRNLEIALVCLKGWGKINACEVDIVFCYLWNLVILFGVHYQFYLDFGDRYCLFLVAYSNACVTEAVGSDQPKDTFVPSGAYGDLDSDTAFGISDLSNIGILQAQ